MVFKKNGRKQNLSAEQQSAAEAAESRPGASLGGREETNLMLNLKAEVQSLKTTFNKTTWQDQ